jgi:hypothetical protein
MMKLLAIMLASVVICVLACSTPVLADVPPAPCDANTHCDTLLDIMHADITAILVGCAAKKEDRVLINGKPEDGILWTLFGLTPAQGKPIDPEIATILKPMQKPNPVTYSELRFRLKPGYYSALSVSVGDCLFDSIPLTTTNASADRHIVLVKRSNASLQSVSGEGLGGVYGYAPLPGLQIALVGGNMDRPLVARNEVDYNPFESPHGETYMYFFDAVKPGHYTMTVSGYGWTKSIGEVVVSGPGDVVLRYIHSEELGF